MSSTGTEQSARLADTVGGRIGGFVDGGAGPFLSGAAKMRRFEVDHALRSIEDALILLDSDPEERLEIAALERIRDDLAVVLRHVKVDLPG